MRGKLTRTKKLFQIELRLVNWSYYFRATQNFKLRYCLKFTGFQYFLFSKTNRYELRDSRNIQGFALIYDQS